jgi:hypothetical protein
MTHLPYPHSDADPGTETGGQARRGPGNGKPRWVMVAGIIVAVALVLLMVVLHVTGVLGPGDH